MGLGLEDNMEMCTSPRSNRVSSQDKLQTLILQPYPPISSFPALPWKLAETSKLKFRRGLLSWAIWGTLKEIHEHTHTNLDCLSPQDSGRWENVCQEERSGRRWHISTSAVDFLCNFELNFLFRFGCFLLIHRHTNFIVALSDVIH